MKNKADSSTAAMEAAYQEALKGFDRGHPIPWSQVNMAELFRAGYLAGMKHDRLSSMTSAVPRGKLK